MNKEYTLSLDIGTNSIGWAVIDENYELVKKLKHYMWGVRLFDKSNSAAERRIYRNARRRLQRRNERIGLLRNIFADEINKVDSNFFCRLDESYYKLEDRTIPCNDLFKDGMTNVEYYKSFPTIWHLRKYILENDEKIDIRLLYLAIHHIIKYRGNFLIEGEFKKGDNSALLNEFKIINDAINELYDKYINDEDFEGNCDFFLSTIIDESKVKDIVETLISNKTKNDKKIKLEELFAVKKEEKIIKNTVYNKFIIPLLYITALLFERVMIMVSSIPQRP